MCKSKMKALDSQVFLQAVHHGNQSIFLFVAIHVVLECLVYGILSYGKICVP